MTNTCGELFWGQPGMGKTTLAHTRMVQRASERMVPCIWFDIERNLHPQGAVAFRDVGPESIIEPIWDRGQHVVYSPPADPDCIERFFSIVSGGGNVCLLVDESHNVARGASASPALMHLCRTRRPSGIDLYFTSTHCGDAHAVVWSVKTSCFVFRHESAFALDRLTRELGLTDADKMMIRNLQPYEFIRFPQTINATPDRADHLLLSGWRKSRSA